MKRGILGGTFDPPHNGHLAVAKAAQEALGLDQVLFVPNQRNPLKTKRPGASAKQRLEMVQLAVESEPSFAVSDQEMQRGGPSYTIDTLDELMAVAPAETWLILGFDAILEFREWKSWQRILKMARLACIPRGSNPWEVDAMRIPPELASFIDVIPMKPIDVSSTEIRTRLFDGKPLGPVLPPKVAAYIKENGLYRG